MKKIFLLSAVLLISAIQADAVNWQPVTTNIPNLNLYIDNDSIKQINSQEYLYAIKYQLGTKPEQVAYLKSNSTDDYIGIINAGDYDEDNYKPQAVFANPHVFMKPVNKDSFLSYAHNYAVGASNTAISSDFAKPILRETEIPVSYTQKNSQKISSAQNLKEYVSETAQNLYENWNPPKTGQNTQAIIILTIGSDGSLQNYKFAKQSGNIMTDRSIVSAVEQCVPYAKFPKSVKSTGSMNIQFVFDYKMFKKSVI